MSISWIKYVVMELMDLTCFISLKSKFSKRENLFSYVYDKYMLMYVCIYCLYAMYDMCIYICMYVLRNKPIVLGFQNIYMYYMQIF